MQLTMNTSKQLFNGLVQTKFIMPIFLVSLILGIKFIIN